VSSKALEVHRKLKGKIEVRGKFKVRSMNDLSIIYTPHVAEVALEIARDRSKVYEYTIKHDTIAIITDGSRVLGLGNIGAEAALPVMEGKALIFKEYADVNAFPICLSTTDKEEMIRAVKAISPSFAAMSIEDIESPKCLEIVDRLQQELDIPVFHDDQHGTAVVVLAALLNALRLVGKSASDVKITVVGAGAAGYGITSILVEDGSFNPSNITVLDSKGIISKQRMFEDNPYKRRIADLTNRSTEGSLRDALNGSDVLIGVSGKAGLISMDMLRLMARDAIVFALTNPDPEVKPYEARRHARILATGRSDYYNQINNAVVFPHLIRSVIDKRRRVIDWSMLVRVAYAIAEYTRSKEWFDERHIIPTIMDRGLREVIASVID
jgi:malate dehydrogenase (oxaloacetate-decarboxylating)